MNLDFTPEIFKIKGTDTVKKKKKKEAFLNEGITQILLLGSFLFGLPLLPQEKLTWSVLSVTNCNLA